MSKKSIIRLSFIVLLTAVFMYLFLRSQNWREVGKWIAGINPWWGIAAVLITPIHLFTRGYRWKYLLHYEKPDIRFYSLWGGQAVGFLFTFIFPGRLGEVVKALFVARREKIRAGFVMGTVVVERAFDIFTVCFLLGVFLVGRPLYHSKFTIGAEGFSTLYTWGAIALGVGVLLLGIILAFYFFREKALRVASRVFKILPHGLRDRVMRLLCEFIDGLKIFHNLGNFAAYVGLGFVEWLSIFFYYWIYFFAFGYPIPFFFLFPYIFLTAIGASIPSPGMAGGFHFFSQMGLTLILGMTREQATGFTLVIHAVQLVVSCLIGYIILTREGLGLFQLKKLGEKGET